MRATVPCNHSVGAHKFHTPVYTNFRRKCPLSLSRCSQPTSRSSACPAKASNAGFDGGSVDQPGPADNLTTFSAQLGGFLTCSIATAVAALGGGSGGGSSTGGNGGGGGGGDGGSSELFELAVAATDEEEDKEEAEDGEEESGSEEEVEESGSGEETESVSGGDESVTDDEDEWEHMKERMGPKAASQYVDEIVLEGFPEGEGVPTKEELLAPLRCQPGFVCSRRDMSVDLRSFMNFGVFHDVQARIAKGKDGKTVLCFKFIENDMPAPKSVDVKPYKGTQKLALPNSVINMARNALLREEGPLNAKKLFRLRNAIDSWYHKRGYTNCIVATIEGMDTGALKVKVLEGKVNDIKIVQVDADGKPTGKPGHVLPHVILREVPFRKGQIFNADLLQKCLRDVFGLGLFESMSVNGKASPRDDTKIDIELMLKERPLKTADLELEWQVAPGNGGKPSISSWVPGGSLTWENGNVAGTGRHLSATASTANFLDPSEDIGYQLTYRHPDFISQSDPKRTEFSAIVFNTRKLSAVFAPGPGKEEVPSIFVDRTGAKLMFTEEYSRNSSGTYGLVFEQVANMDDTGALTPSGTKLLLTREYDPNGPPTSFSGTGKDTVGFLQAKFTRDRTFYYNGAQLGDRQTLQVEQGLGIGTGRPVFNRHRLTATRFHQLGKIESKVPPKVLVLQGRYGGCLGDQLPYDLFTLGGPFSVRGYNFGEVASARFFLEGAAELRVPVKGRTAYVFAEGATDLGSSASVLGNPTGYFKRPGSAVSLGAGVKLGAARLECATEGFARPTVLNIRFGERF